MHRMVKMGEDKTIGPGVGTHFGLGPWTTSMDWVHGPSITDQVHGHFF